MITTELEKLKADHKRIKAHNLKLRYKVDHQKRVSRYLREDVSRLQKENQDLKNKLPIAYVETDKNKHPEVRTLDESLKLKT